MGRADIGAIAALHDPQRRRLFQVVHDASGPVTREEAAGAVGISRKLAAFHLDRLVAAGLLVATFDQPAGGRRGVGRAPKRYRTADVELAVSIPDRNYDLAGEILVDAVASGDDPAGSETTHEAVGRVARDRGRAIGAEARARRRLGRLGPERALAVVAELLEEHGFEPAVSDEGLIERNCPFHRLARRSPELVCGMNRDFVDGILDGLEARRLRAELAPADGRCCVVVRS